MSSKNCLLPISLLALLLAFIGQYKCEDNMWDIYQKTAAEIIEIRGFRAKNYYVTTTDGYILNVIRGTNPLINNGESGLPDRAPVLFVHGALTNAQGFLINSKGASPKDYSGRNVTSMSLDELYELIGEDPNSKSLCFTAMNFGHECWLLNRRGTRYSLGNVNEDMQPYSSPIEDILSALNGGGGTNELGLLTNNLLTQTVSDLIKPLVEAISLNVTSNPRYWNFSYDEQAEFDVPEVIDFILEETKHSRLAYVGQSAGGGLGLLALTENKTLNDKLSKTILWAPAVDLGADPSESVSELIASTPLSDIFMAFSGPVPPTALVPVLQDLAAALCSTSLTQNTICREIFSSTYGPSGDQQLIVAAVFGGLIESVSSHELAHLAQFVKTNRSRKYDYGLPQANLARYNQTIPPVYNFSTITTESLSIWYGNKDAQVTIADIEMLEGDLRGK